MIDAHIHLEQYPDEHIESLIEQWRAAGVEYVIAVSTNLPSSYRTLELQTRFPDFVRAAIGFHPEQLPPDETELDELLSLIRQERHRLAAIGEVGLPHYELSHLPSSALLHQQELLDRYAALGRELCLPLLLHAVHDKAALALDCLQRHPGIKAHFHWLKAPKAVVAEIVAAGFYLSLTPEVCYRERDQRLARQIPLEQLMLETDGPWPFSGPFTGQATSPMMLFAAAKTTAFLKGVPPEQLIRQCTENTRRLLS
ncbi:TatD family hydrolase [Brevibacillus humidisoli]|uniref:TatD family hydrolase n=1 Tax=Brevibacillus humidisoli TaxID=2895522 RepID=UPI001E5A1C05|nr:TatD family hydrolase [Brevibacillus humidisoli]UFJ42369.1 TatD family hydrolase [Brevibacillus humidisoli]